MAWASGVPNDAALVPRSESWMLTRTGSGGTLPSANSGGGSTHRYGGTGAWPSNSGRTGSSPVRAVTATAAT
jgi:hypothetical protein